MPKRRKGKRAKRRKREWERAQLQEGLARRFPVTVARLTPEQLAAYLKR